MAPAVEFFGGGGLHIIDWWKENGPIFIAAWENIAAAIQWVIGEVICPIFEWAWPYIEQIVNSGVLEHDVRCSRKSLRRSSRGDWGGAAGEALVDITKGAMAGTHRG